MKMGWKISQPVTHFKHGIICNKKTVKFLYAAMYQNSVCMYVCVCVCREGEEMDVVLMSIISHKTAKSVLNARCSVVPSHLKQSFYTQYSQMLLYHITQ